MDGLHNDAIIATTIQEKNRIFLSGLDCEDNSKTTEFSVKNLKENIEKCKSEYGNEVAIYGVTVVFIYITYI